MEQLKTYLHLGKKYFSSSFKKYYVNVNDEKRQQFVAYLYIVMSLFSLSFFGFFAIRPTINTIANLNRQLEDNRVVLTKLESKLQALEKLSAQFQTIQSNLTLVQAAIPNNNDIPLLSRKIELLALDNNLAITELTFGTIELYPAQKDDLFSFPVSLTIEGDEGDINHFISSLVNIDRIISLERLVTGRAGNAGFSATLTGRAYFLPDQIIK